MSKNGKRFEKFLREDAQREATFAANASAIKDLRQKKRSGEITPEEEARLRTLSLANQTFSDQKRGVRIGDRLRELSGKAPEELTAQEAGELVLLQGSMKNPTVKATATGSLGKEAEDIYKKTIQRNTDELVSDSQTKLAAFDKSEKARIAQRNQQWEQEAFDANLDKPISPAYWVTQADYKAAFGTYYNPMSKDDQTNFFQLARSGAKPRTDVPGADAGAFIPSTRRPDSVPTFQDIGGVKVPETAFSRVQRVPTKTPKESKYEIVPTYPEEEQREAQQAGYRSVETFRAAVDAAKEKTRREEEARKDEDIQRQAERIAGEWWEKETGAARQSGEPYVTGEPRIQEPAPAPDPAPAPEPEPQYGVEGPGYDRNKPFETSANFPQRPPEGWEKESATARPPGFTDQELQPKKPWTPFWRASDQGLYDLMKDAEEAPKQPSAELPGMFDMGQIRPSKPSKATPQDLSGVGLYGGVLGQMRFARGQRPSQPLSSEMGPPRSDAELSKMMRDARESEPAPPPEPPPPPEAPAPDPEPLPEKGPSFSDYQARMGISPLDPQWDAAMAAFQGSGSFAKNLVQSAGKQFQKGLQRINAKAAEIQKGRQSDRRFDVGEKGFGQHGNYPAQGSDEFQGGITSKGLVNLPLLPGESIEDRRKEVLQYYKEKMLPSEYFKSQGFIEPAPAPDPAPPPEVPLLNAPSQRAATRAKGPRGQSLKPVKSGEDYYVFDQTTQDWVLIKGGKRTTAQSGTPQSPSFNAPQQRSAATAPQQVASAISASQQKSFNQASPITQEMASRLVAAQTPGQISTPLTGRDLTTQDRDRFKFDSAVPASVASSINRVTPVRTPLGQEPLTQTERSIAGGKKGEKEMASFTKGMSAAEINAEFEKIFGKEQRNLSIEIKKDMIERFRLGELMQEGGGIMGMNPMYEIEIDPDTGEVKLNPKKRD